jgi:prevent-host-death family protein
VTTLQLATAKARFSSIISAAQSGEETIITKGHSKTPVAVIVPFKDWQDRHPHELGTLAHLGPVRFSDDWHMSEDELIELL